MAVLDIRMVHELGVRLASRHLEMIESWVVMAHSSQHHGGRGRFLNLWSLHLHEGTEDDQDLSLPELIAKRRGDA